MSVIILALTALIFERCLCEDHYVCNDNTTDTFCANVQEDDSKCYYAEYHGYRSCKALCNGKNAKHPVFEICTSKCRIYLTKYCLLQTTLNTTNIILHTLTTPLASMPFSPAVKPAPDAQIEDDVAKHVPLIVASIALIIAIVVRVVTVVCTIQRSNQPNVERNNHELEVLIPQIQNAQGEQPAQPINVEVPGQPVQHPPALAAAAAQSPQPIHGEVPQHPPALQPAAVQSPQPIHGEVPQHPPSLPPAAAQSPQPIHGEVPQHPPSLLTAAAQSPQPIHGEVPQHPPALPTAAAQSPLSIHLEFMQNAEPVLPTQAVDELPSPQIQQHALPPLYQHPAAGEADVANHMPMVQEQGQLSMQHAEPMIPAQAIDLLEPPAPQIQQHALPPQFQHPADVANHMAMVQEQGQLATQHAEPEPVIPAQDIDLPAFEPPASQNQLPPLTLQPAADEMQQDANPPGI